MNAWMDGNSGARREPLPTRFAEADRVPVTDLLAMLGEYLVKGSPTREDTLAALASSPGSVAGRR